MKVSCSSAVNSKCIIALVIIPLIKCLISNNIVAPFSPLLIKKSFNNRPRLVTTKSVCLFCDKGKSTESSSSSSSLDVIRQYMGEENSMTNPDQPVLVEGISGFAVDKDLGFVAILTSTGDDDRGSIFVIISTEDTGEIRSAESLCLVQLAGGMDLGTSVLPPDLLSNLVAKELTTDDDDTIITSEQIRRSVKLLEVQVVPTNKEENITTTTLNETSSNISSPERRAKLEKDVPKFLSSIRNLPGLSKNKEQVLEVLEEYSDENGNLDREAFSSALKKLRSANKTKNQQLFEFILIVSNQGTIQRIPLSSAFYAVGLALRYNAAVTVTKKDNSTTQMNYLKDDEILSRFPRFRPLIELKEDAKIMDAFIPSMFAKATATRPNDAF